MQMVFEQVGEFQHYFSPFATKQLAPRGLVCALSSIHGIVDVFSSGTWEVFRDDAVIDWISDRPTMT